MGFEDIKNVSAQRDSSYLRAGRYVALINEFVLGKTRAQRKYARFGLTILHVIDDAAGAAVDGGSHRVGEKATWMLMDDVDAATPALKAALMVATEIDEEDIDFEAIKSLAAEAQPLRGVFVEVDSIQIITKKGAPFTLNKFKRLLTDDDVREMVPAVTRKSLGLGLDD